MTSDNKINNNNKFNNNNNNNNDDDNDNVLLFAFTNIDIVRIQDHSESSRYTPTMEILLTRSSSIIIIIIINSEQGKTLVFKENEYVITISCLITIIY